MLGSKPGLLQAMGELILTTTLMFDSSYLLPILCNCWLSLSSIGFCDTYSGNQEKVHLDNIDASLAVLRKFSNEWKDYSAKFSPPDALRQTIKNLTAEVYYHIDGMILFGRL